MKRILLLLLIVVSMGLTGCNSHVVPPGTVVIVLKSGGEATIHTNGSYMAWGRDRVYFVDTKLKSFTEHMKVLCKDNINMIVDTKWIGSFNTSPNAIKVIKEKVPAIKINSGGVSGYQLSLTMFYRTALKDIIRANTRNVVARYSTDEVRQNRVAIQSAIKKRILRRLQELNYPVITTDVMLSNLDYPAEITNQRKAIKNAQLEDEKQEALSIAAIKQAKREAGIAREKGKAEIETAKADAAANLIRSRTLTPAIIAMRQWDVLNKLVGSKGTMMIVPYKALGNFTNSAMIRKTLRK